MKKKSAFNTVRKLAAAAAGVLAFGAASASQEWWFPIVNGPGPGGYVRGLALFNTSPNTLFAAVYGSGVKKSTNAGSTWTDASNGIKDLRIRAISRTPGTLATSVLYVATEGGVFRSTDQGANWSAVNNGLQCRDVRAVSIPATPTEHVIYAGTFCPGFPGSGIYKLNTGTLTWALVSGPANGGNGLLINSIAGSGDGVNIHAASSSGRWSTNDALTGNNWTQRVGISPNDMTGNGTSPSGANNFNNLVNINVGTGAADYAYVPGMGVLKTTDGGSNTYVQVNSGLPLAAPNVRSLAGVSFVGGTCNKFYLGVDGHGIYESTDPENAGWTQLAGSPRFARGVAVDTNNCAVLYAPTLAGVAKYDGGWTQLTSLSRGIVTNISGDSANPSITYAASDTVWKSVNGGESWAVSGSGIGSTTAFGNVIASSSTPNKVYASTNGNGFYVSTDAGANWTETNAGLTGLGINLTEANMQIRVDSLNGEILYAFFRGRNTTGVLKSTNGGVSWAMVNNGLAMPLTVNDVRPAPSNSSIVYAATSAGPYRSTDGGASWSYIGFGIGNISVGTMRVDPFDPNQVLLGTTLVSPGGFALPASGLYETGDGGQTWELLYGNERVNNFVHQRPSPNVSASRYVSSRGWGGDFTLDSAFVGHMADNSGEVNGSPLVAESRGGIDKAYLNSYAARGNRVRLAATHQGVYKHRPTFYGPDFDNDARFDILWRHQGSGQTYVWRMDGRSLKAHGSVFTLADMNWQPTTGDFNGDGRSDILWRHMVSGQNYLWTIENQTIVGQGALQTLADLNWKIVAVADVDRDGRADIVWRYEGAGANQGLVYVWRMDGTALLGSAPISKVSDLSWKVVGSGDFDGDGFNDLFWWHQGSGQTYIWLLGPTPGAVGLKGSAASSTVADLNWRVAGVGDFNADGKADLIWRHNGNGQNAIWMMNGLSILTSGLTQSGQAPVSVPDQGWKIVGAGDYNADGFSDLLWRHDTTGQNYVWQMNGFQLSTACGICGTGTGDLPTVTDTNWKVVNK